jgi:hypothetical protein
MARALEHLFGPMFEKLVGREAIFGGILLAVALWFLDYAVLEWRVRKHYSVVMAVVGVGCVVGVLWIDWEPWALLRCGIVGFVFYLPLRLSIRRSAYDRHSDKAD